MNRDRMEGRGPSRNRIQRDQDLQPMVQRLIENAPQYEPRARVDDGLAINEVILVPRQQQGAASALHAKWQEEGFVDRLSPDDCEALSRAGFKVERDRDGFWAWWREKKLSHMWLALGPDGWRSTQAPHPRGQWKLLGNAYEPLLPYFEDYAVTPQMIVRESLVMALAVMRHHAPTKVFGEKFFAVAKDLCDEAVLGLITDQAWFNDILQQVPVVNCTSMRPHTEDVETSYRGEIGHS